ncbi:MAG: hypothetical protein D3908_16845 [Candidatus Electrothrix sp. AUS4]|nr:hypothetical protein [Candidatus Electrothrix sp. AUS4]
MLQISETSLSYHLMAMSLVRQKLLSLEEEFLARGVLKCKGDIFFLHFREIVDMQQGLLDWPDIEEVIHQRRHDLIRATRKTPPRTIGVGLSKKSQVNSTSFTTPRVILQGQTASPGNYTGRARIILDHQKDATLLPGEILVAPYTDPSWTPLFLIAGGAVIEIGSYLTHAGTAAREYTLPCIVDVAECTKRIQDGDLLWINGEKGEVHILEARNPAKGKTAEDTL